MKSGKITLPAIIIILFTVTDFELCLKKVPNYQLPKNTHTTKTHSNIKKIIITNFDFVMITKFFSIKILI